MELKLSLLVRQPHSLELLHVDFLTRLHLLLNRFDKDAPKQVLRKQLLMLMLVLNVPQMQHANHKDS